MQALLGIILLLATLGLPSVAAQQNSGILRGTVKDPLGAVISQATVQLISTEEAFQTASDAGGSFEFSVPPSDTYALIVYSPGFRTSQTRVLVRAGRPTGEKVTLEVASTSSCGFHLPTNRYDRLVGTSRAVFGTLAAGDSPPKPLAAQVVLMKAKSDEVMASTTSNSHGEFVLNDIEPGEYVLRARQKGYHEAASRPFWVTRKNVTRVSLVLFEEGTQFVCQ